MEPEEIAARVWPGREVELEPLGGGITNRNYKVAVGDETFVLRIGGKDTALLGIDREAEHVASSIAADLGIGPEVVAFLEPEGYLVTRFVEGSPLPVEEVREAETLRRVTETLRRFHDGPSLPVRFDSFRVVEAYLTTAASRGVATPRDYEQAKQTADEIERAQGRQPEHPCHNDLLNANFIGQDGDVRIVDWEYAGMGDRFFDLANFSINHELTDDQNEALLKAYFGETREQDLRSLRLMRFMSDFREAMWGVVQQGLSELDFDFLGYADEHFARLERTAADPAFRESLR
ncbi:MAG: phosphotransferase [Actinobacteria bacterium]|nr:phosphotransferase [Actinomycetota bacterium]